jgi:uncharacterized membrane protein YhaH (DUF805 family)
MKPVGLDQILTFFFRPVGRITRVEFALATLLILCIDGAILMQLVGHPELRPGPVFAVMILGLPLLIAQLVVAAKRCHDMGLPGSFVLLLVIPGFGAAWLVALALFPGKAGPNAYGPEPRFEPN